MHRTVHVRTVFPSGSGPCRTVVYSRSGQGAEARSLFFVLRASDAAARAPALAAALLDTDERDPSALAALADAALPGPVADRDLALLVVAPPVEIGYVVGRGVLAIVTEGTVRMSEPGFAGAGTLGMERVGAGHAWQDAARVGDGFVLGLTDHLARLSAAEVATLPAWLDRSARSHPLERALSDLSRQDGALIVGRVHHVTAAAPAVARPLPRSTTRRASLRYALALVAAALAFIALVEAGASGRSSVPTDHALTPRWSRAVRDPGPGRPVWMGDVLALTRAGPRPTLDLLDPFSGTTLRSWPLSVSDPGQPIRAGACLVVAGNAGPAVAMDVESGATRWTVTLPGPVDAFATMEDRLWIASGHRLLGLDARSGRVRFDTPLPGPVVGLDVTQGIGVAVSASGDVSAFEPSGGVHCGTSTGRVNRRSARTSSADGSTWPRRAGTCPAIMCIEGTANGRRTSASRS